MSTQFRRCVLLLRGCAEIRALACIMSYSLTRLQRVDTAAAAPQRPTESLAALERDLVFCRLDLGGVGSFDAIHFQQAVDILKVAVLDAIGDDELGILGGDTQAGLNFLGRGGVDVDLRRGVSVAPRTRGWSCRSSLPDNPRSVPTRDRSRRRPCPSWSKPGWTSLRASIASAESTRYRGTACILFAASRVPPREAGPGPSKRKPATRAKQQGDSSKGLHKFSLKIKWRSSYGTANDVIISQSLDTDLQRFVAFPMKPASLRLRTPPGLHIQSCQRKYSINRISYGKFLHYYPKISVYAPRAGIRIEGG